MNPRQKMTFACTLLWTILGLVMSSSGKPSDANGGGPITLSTLSQSSQAAKVGGVPSAVVPQIGVLEERPDVSGVEAGTLPVIMGGPSVTGTSPGHSDGTIGNAGKGILVPIVSVSGGDSPKSTGGNLNSPLVALLPAPLPSESESKLPGIPTVSVLQLDDQPQKPQIRRSLATGNGDKSSAEIMDTAEDIVFRPLFRIRQPSGRNRERNYRPNYRRYNINGYYRLPYD